MSEIRATRGKESAMTRQERELGSVLSIWQAADRMQWRWTLTASQRRALRGMTQRVLDRKPLRAVDDRALAAIIVSFAAFVAKVERAA